MKKWEYLTVPLIVHTTKAILDNYGEEGWELVAVLPGAPAPSGPNPAGNMVAPTQGNPIAYLKREKVEVPFAICFYTTLHICGARATNHIPGEPHD